MDRNIECLHILEIKYELHLSSLLSRSQVRNDYLLANHAALDQDVAVQLCCLEIRYFFKDMPQIALDKKSNLEYLEREVLRTFLKR